MFILTSIFFEFLNYLSIKKKLLQYSNKEILKDLFNIYNVIT